jgi:hypothetical protein
VDLAHGEAAELARAGRLADLDQLLRERFGAKVVRRGLALSRRHGAPCRAKSVADNATEPTKGAA